MKNNFIILLASILFVSCNSISGESTGIITTSDQKTLMVKSHMEAYMNKDSSVAEKLFAENLELYDQFSNNQKDNKTVVNPGGRQGLIEGDKFAHILFSDVKVTTDKIQTYNLNDGRIYTAFWSMWSGKGNFTGKETTLPFYVISLWEGNQIAKIWRYMDPTAFNKEVAAYEGINKSSAKVLGLAELKINKGFKKSDVEEFMVRFTKFVRETEPNTYDFGYFISADGRRVNLVEKYYTAADFVHHLNNFEQSDYSKEFMTLFTLEKVIISGDASEELKAKAKAYGAELRTQVGGWIN
jgi:hypothetical protein